MKKLMLALTVMVGMFAKGYCGQMADFFDSLYQKQNFVFLESAAPIVFYDLETGNENKTRAGFVSPFYHYGFMTADAGWLTAPLDSTPFKEGHPLLGGSVHVDELVSMYFPQVTSFVYAITPDSTHALIKRFTLGFGATHDFAQQKFIFGPYTGIVWKF